MLDDKKRLDHFKYIPARRIESSQWKNFIFNEEYQLFFLIL